MALTAQSRAVNIQKSLNVYFHTTLVTADSVQVHFPGQRGIFTPTGATWVQLHYLLGLAREWIGPADDSLNPGNLVTGTINLNCCELVDQRSGISYALASLRDTVRARVAEGTAIVIRDYDTGGNPVAGYMHIISLDENETSDGLSPDDNGIAIWNLSASVRYVEADS